MLKRFDCRRCHIQLFQEEQTNGQCKSCAMTHQDCVRCGKPLGQRSEKEIGLCNDCQQKE